MAGTFSSGSFGLRWLFSILLVFGTYNPTHFSFIGWVLGAGNFGPVAAIVGILLLIGWIIFVRATFMSLGWLGIILGSALFACIIWLFVDIGWLRLDSANAMSWVVLLLISLILALGMSWSFIRRRMTGQVDTDDLDDGRG